MNKKIFLKQFLAFLVIVGFLFGNLAMAQLVPGCRGASCGWCDLFQLVANIINFIVKIIVPPVAGLLILWGGIMILVSGGNENSVTKGKNILRDTFIGLIIIYTSYLIVYTLVLNLAGNTDGTKLNPGGWTFTCS